MEFCSKEILTILLLRERNTNANITTMQIINLLNYKHGLSIVYICI